MAFIHADQTELQRRFDRDMAVNTTITPEQKANLQKALGKTYTPFSDEQNNSYLNAKTQAESTGGYYDIDEHGGPVVHPGTQTAPPPPTAPPPAPMLPPSGTALSSLQSLMQTTMANTPPGQTYQPPAPQTPTAAPEPSAAPGMFTGPQKKKPTAGAAPDPSVAGPSQINTQSPALSGLKNSQTARY